MHTFVITHASSMPIMPVHQRSLPAHILQKRQALVVSAGHWHPPFPDCITCCKWNSHVDLN